MQGTNLNVVIGLGRARHPCARHQRPLQQRITQTHFVLAPVHRHRREAQHRRRGVPRVHHRLRYRRQRRPRVLGIHVRRVRHRVPRLEIPPGRHVAAVHSGGHGVRDQGDGRGGQGLHLCDRRRARDADSGGGDAGGGGKGRWQAGAGGLEGDEHGRAVDGDGERQQAVPRRRPHRRHQPRRRRRRRRRRHASRRRAAPRHLLGRAVHTTSPGARDDHHPVAGPSAAAVHPGRQRVGDLLHRRRHELLYLRHRRCALRVDGRCDHGGLGG
mmetsp:Transcript_46838/g.101821  ORF Transcript_46838/g.101821 Transcript_46838/m.101821 type:complete len:270 (-) Transcript_46838:2443-3252(-)